MDKRNFFIYELAYFFAYLSYYYDFCKLFKIK